MKRVLRRIPGLVSVYRKVRVLGWVLQDWCWSDAQQMSDRAHLTREWDFEVLEERQRYELVLGAVTEHRGRGPWGTALEAACAEGLFTLELARRCSGVTACDISPVACTRAAERCKEFPNVRISQWDIRRDPVVGSYDLVFLMAALSFVHGRRQLGRVTQKLADALRPGGLLVFNEMRLLPEAERALWTKWLAEGALQNVAFMDGRHGLWLISKRVYEELYPGYVVALFDKTRP